MKLPIIFALSGLLVAGAPDAQISVPGDHPTLAQAISAAPPGATIVVSTPQLQAPVILDKPVKILGDPVANIGTDGLCHGPPTPAVLLAGPGSGTVVISGVNLVQCFDAPQMRELLSGGGFSDVHVYDSTILTSLTGFSGLGYGSAAISVSVPFLMLSGCSVLGGRDDIDNCWVGGFPTLLPPLNAYPAVEAPGSTVAVLDSSIFGGSHNSQCCVLCTCPTDLSVIAGAGGTGIIASRVIEADSTVAGGAGATYHANFQFCGATPSGQAYQTENFDTLPGVVAGSGPIRLGSTWTLNYFVPGPAAVLVFSFGTEAPTQLAGLGWSFLGPGILVLGQIPTGISASLPIPVPTDKWLLGQEVSFQIFDTSIGLTRPVLGPLVP